MRRIVCGAVALLLTLTTPVKALTDRQIIDKLNTIPAFAIVTKEGNPLVGRIKTDKEDVGVIVVFIDGTLARKSFDDFKKNAPPDVSKLYQVVPISLGEAFEAARKEGQNKDSKIRYSFQAAPETVQSALAKAQKVDANLKEFPGLPVFYLGRGTEPLTFTRGMFLPGKDGKPIVYPRITEPLLPFFFKEKDVDDLYTQLKEVQPDLASKASVQVMSLFRVLDLMLDPKNERLGQAVNFVADEDALKYVDTIQKALPPNFLKDAPKPAAPDGKP